MADFDKEQILALLHAQEDAAARGDAKAVIAPIAPDVVAYDLPPPLEYRRDAARDVKGLEQWFDTWDGPVTVKLADPTVLVDGDLAVVFGMSRMSGVSKQGGPFESWNRRTVVLGRSNSTWTIIHEHNSYPMLMDGSGRAATDLKP